jgi:signal peptidase I
LTRKRGDIVVFNPPAAWQQENGHALHQAGDRVGGDTVEIKDGHVYVQRTELTEPYVFKEDDGSTQTTEDP